MQPGPHIEIADAARPPNLDDVRRLVIEYLCDFLPPGAADERRLRPRDRNALRRLPEPFLPPGGALRLARLDGRPAGCVALRPLEPGVAEVKRLYVRPAARRRGVGRALVETALAAAEQLDYQMCRLDVVADRAPAVRLYQSLGWREIPPWDHHEVPMRAFELRLG